MQKAPLGEPFFSMLPRYGPVVHGVMAAAEPLNFKGRWAGAILFTPAGVQPLSGQLFDQHHTFAVPVVFALARLGQGVDIGLHKAAF